MKRKEIACRIAARLAEELARMKSDFAQEGRVPSALIDDLLPAELASQLYAKFPPCERMMVKKSIKENKLVGAQMDQFDPLIEETVYAFQEQEVISLVGAITGLKGLEPDAELYAGGISVMTKGGYLRPHLDNSHDNRRDRYRVINLLYYVTPEWREEYGGSLQLWDEGPLKQPRTIDSRFNRLVLMATNQTSWHSVSEILAVGKRCCVSNYYFSRISPEQREYFHATSFRGEKAGLNDKIMMADNALRTTILRTAPGLYINPHVYKRRPETDGPKFK